jgi:hypothetical protein
MLGQSRQSAVGPALLPVKENQPSMAGLMILKDRNRHLLSVGQGAAEEVVFSRTDFESPVVVELQVFAQVFL